MSSHHGLGAVLVTGGAGFIGCHVAEALLKRGETVIIADEVNDYYDTQLKRRNLRYLKEAWGDQVKIYEGDICDALFVEEMFVAEKPLNRVVHLAARAGVRPSIDDPFVYIHSNLEATTRLLEMARVHGCEHFVYASSSSVYGESNQEIFSESDVVESPVSPYAATKKMCELTAYTYHHLYGIPVAGLRFFTVYGPKGRPDMAPFKFVDWCMRGVPIKQFGDGSSSRDYTYIDDIVDGVVRCLDTPKGYQIYNLGNGNPIALKKFIAIVEECCGKKAVIDLQPMQPGDVPRTCANIDKAKAELGYEPLTSFEDGIAKTVAWYVQEYAPQKAAQQEAKAAAEEAAKTQALQKAKGGGGGSSTATTLAPGEGEGGKGKKDSGGGGVFSGSSSSGSGTKPEQVHQLSSLAAEEPPTEGWGGRGWRRGGGGGGGSKGSFDNGLGLGGCGGCGGSGARDKDKRSLSPFGRAVLVEVDDTPSGQPPRRVLLPNALGHRGLNEVWDKKSGDEDDGGADAKRMIECLHLEATTGKQATAIQRATSASTLNQLANAQSWSPGTQISSGSGARSSGGVSPPKKESRPPLPDFFIGDGK